VQEAVDYYLREAGQLRGYCKLDTLALVRLARFLAAGGTRR
jgi:hypothetical protein